MKALLQKKNLEIECLRGIAILITILNHINGFLLPFPNATIKWISQYLAFGGGVDLFFVISGFVISASFLSSFEKLGSYWKACKSFWIKRVFRIFPAAWFWMGIYLLATLYTNEKALAFGFYDQNFRDMSAAFFQWANIYGLHCIGRFADLNCGPNGIYWSLSLEEQFYVFFPLAVILLQKKLKSVLFALAIMQFLLPRDSWTFFWVIRTDALLWGVLLTLWLPEIRNRFAMLEILRSQTALRALVAISLVLAITYFPAAVNGYALGTGILGLVCFVLVLLASFDRGYVFQEGVLRSALTWLGSRSYSYYLVHIISFRFSYEILGLFLSHSLPATESEAVFLWPISIVLTPILAEFSYLVIEIPLRNYGHKLAVKII